MKKKAHLVDGPFLQLGSKLGSSSKWPGSHDTLVPRPQGPCLMHDYAPWWLPSSLTRYPSSTLFPFLFGGLFIEAEQ